MPAIITKEWGVALAKTLNGLHVGEYRGDNARLLRDGGGMNSHFSTTPESVEDVAKSLAKPHALSIETKGDFLRLFRDIALFKPVEDFGARIELVPRTVSRKLAEKYGVKDRYTGKTRTDVNSLDSVNAARTVTLDFDRGGDFSRTLNQIIPFFNVGMQSASEPFRAYKENPVAYPVTIAALVAGPIAAAEMWNRSDPQMKQDYADVPEYMKDQGLVLMLRGQAPQDETGNRRPQFLHIRYRQLSGIAVATRKLYEGAFGELEKRNPDGFMDIMRRGMMPLSPISGSNISDTFTSIMPPQAATALQLSQDKDIFRDKKINTKFGDMQATALSKGASAVSSAVTEKLGLDPKWAGTPSQWEFGTKDFLGGRGSVAQGTSDLIESGLSKLGVPGARPRVQGTPQDMPVVGGAFGRFIKGSTGGELDEAKENKLPIKTVWALKSAGVDYKPGDVDSFLGKTPLLRIEQAELQFLTNKYIQEDLEKLMSRPNWSKATPEQRDYSVREYSKAAREAAKHEISNRISKEEALRRIAALTPERRR